MRSAPCPPRDDLDFEIGFYEGIINDAPRYVDALMLLGEAYTRKGLYEKGLEIDRRITALRPRDPVAYYNLACSYSLLRQRQQALRCLRRSIILGYSDLHHMANDQDLSFLHGDMRFHSLLRYIGRRLLREIRRKLKR